MEWVHREPTDRDPGLSAPYCSHCGWFGSDDDAEDARRDRVHGTEMRLAYAIIVWIVMGSEMAWLGAPWWSPLLIVPVTLIPVIRFRYWNRDANQRAFEKRMKEMSRAATSRGYRKD